MSVDQNNQLVEKHEDGRNFTINRVLRELNSSKRNFDFFKNLLPKINF